MSERVSRSPFSRRRWRRRLGGWAPVLVGLSVAGVLAFLGWVVFFSSWLAVDDVDVSGTRTLSAADVQAAAGVEAGTPLVRLDLSEIADRVEELPEVADASAHRSWPHTVTISVTERSPVAAVEQDGAWWVMDADGVVFRRTRERVESVPEVRTQRTPSDEQLREVASVVVALPDDVLTQTSRIQARSLDSITLRLTGGRRVVWGSAADSERKVEVLRVLLEQAKGASEYDVSVPEQPTTTQ